MRALRRLLLSVSRWYAVVAMLALIFALSSIPNVAEPHRYVIPYDKVAHFGEYSVLALVLAGSLRRKAAGRLPLVLLIAAAVTFGAAYGASDEFHQRFVPGRDPDVMDWLADVSGSLAGAMASVALLRAEDLRRKRST